MAYFNGTIAYATSGVKSKVTTGFMPSVVRATVSQKYATSQTFSHLSIGSGNPTFQHVDSIFQDTSGGKTVSVDGKIVSHYEKVSGVLNEVLAISIDSFYTDGFKLNVLTPNSDYNIYLEAWG